jgi:hypothetical protein
MFPDNDKWCSHQCLEKAPSELVVYFDKILASSLILLPVFFLYQDLVNKRTVQQVNIWRTKSSDSARKSPLFPTLEVVELCKTDYRKCVFCPSTIRDANMTCYQADSDLLELQRNKGKHRHTYRWVGSSLKTISRTCRASCGASAWRPAKNWPRWCKSARAANLITTLNDRSFLHSLSY